MYRKLLSGLCLLIALVSAAKEPAYGVKGEVVDSLGEAASFATIRVYAPGDSVKPAALCAADVDGRFTLPMKASGKYQAVVSAVGSSPLTVDFGLSAQERVADLGRLQLRPDNTLSEVTVTAQKPLVTKEIDRIGYDVASDPDASTSSVLEMLKKVPLVTVDPDGTIKIRGSTDFRVYRNGRPNKSYSSNAKEIFRGLPASAITKIEVITDPGAREDAEGVGAILNIVTTNAVKMTGAMGYAGLHEATSQELPNVWAGGTAQYDKVIVSANAGFWGATYGGTNSSAVSDYVYDDSGNRIRSETESKSRPRSTWWGLDMSFEPDTLNLFTLEYGGNYFHMSTLGQRSTTMWAPDGEKLYSFDANSPEQSSSNIYNYLAANYQRSTRLKDETITLSYQGTFGYGRNNSLTEYSNQVNFPGNYTAIDSRIKANSAEHTVQLDWSRPYGKIFTLDLGGKYIYRNSSSRSTEEYVGDDTQHTNFLHESQVAAGYADLRARYKRMSFRGGLRYEYTHMHGHYREPSDRDNINSDLNDWVPQASVMWNPSDASSFKVSYGMTINRPGIEYLSPTVSKTPTSVSSGNPYLESAKHHSLQANYSLNTAKVSLDVSLSHRFSNDAIIQWMHTEGNILYSTYANHGKTRRTSLSGYIQWQPTAKTQLVLNGNIVYSDYESPIGGDTGTLRANGWSGNVFARLTQRLPWNLRLSGDISYWAGGLYSVYYQSWPEGPGAWDHGFSLQRAFLNDRLNVTLGVQNPFGPYSWHNRAKSFNSGLTGAQITRNNRNWNVHVSVNWTFGSLNAQVKKTAASISNTDLQGGGGSGSQGGGK